MKRKPRMGSKREQLITTALKLFARNGFHATGVDSIVEQSGVTKKTLYTHFRSKEELVLAVLHHYDSLFRNEFMRRVEGAAKTPKGRLLAVFDVAETWFKQNNFYGCMFINAVGEYSEDNAPIRKVCKEYKNLMKAYIRELCVRAGVTEVDRLTEELALLLEGAIVTAQVSKQSKAAQVAKRAAKALIENDLVKKG